MRPTPLTTIRTPRVIFYLIIGLTCLKVWTAPATLTSTAHAQIPDSGSQRNVMIKELRTTNALLQKIHTTLSSGTIKVRIVSADNPPAGTRPGKRR